MSVGALWPLSRRSKRSRILLIDDVFPDARIGGDVPRTAELLRALIAADGQVTVLSTRDHSVEDARGIATLRLQDDADLGHLLSTRHETFAVIIVAHPHNMARVAAVMARDRAVFGHALIVYDAATLSARREIIRLDLRGTPLPPTEARALVADEIANAVAADVILARDAETAAAFVAAGHADVRILGYAVAPPPAASAPFRRRGGFLFVGPTTRDDTPNTDAVIWFADHVLPILRRRLGKTLALTTVGRNLSPQISERCADGRIASIGVVADLAPAFVRARVLVAPSRYAAAAPLKVYDAAAHGLPAVVTPVLAGRLGWRHGDEVLVARSAAAFATACLEAHGDQVLWEGLRAAALARVAADCDPRRFDATVRDLVASAAVRQG